MEHRLILGGEAYLPFARSQIKALRATGQRHGARRWIMPGGETVTIRVVDEHDYIKLEGGGSSLAMDAGIIDLKSVSTGSPLRFANGERQESVSTQAYNAPFTVGATGGRWSAWRSSPATVPRHQIAGTLVAPKFAGHIKPGGLAPSFTAKRKAVTPATDPPTWIDHPEDDALYTKKLMAKTCPASMFTGRLRLYVQAMYGRPLYDYGGDTSVDPITSTVQTPTLAAASMPSLVLPAYKHKGDDTVYTAITIDTSAGVFYRAEATGGKHWLMLVAGNALNVYPLISSRQGESLRKYLNAAPLSDGNPLDPDDVEKLEAFILAYCLPDVKNQFSVAASGATAAFSMGYGWHWNWSGSTADVVTSTNFDQGASTLFPSGSTGMESTHRRVTVAVDAEGNWSAAHAVVEGPKRWAVNRLYWCIAEPEWGSMLTVKTTPKHSAMFECDAPFYAFYDRDALNMCRIKVDVVAATTDVRTFSTNFADPTYGGSVAEYTGGMLDGYCEDAAATAEHYKATITCGGLVVPSLMLGKSTTYARWDVYGKSIVVPPARVPSNDVALGSGVHATLNYGYTSPYGTYDTVEIIGPGITSDSTSPTIRFTRSTNDGVREESSTITAVVPFHDAEAIFSDTATFTTDTRSNQQVSVRDSTGFATGKFWIPSGSGSPPEAIYFQYITAGTAGSIISSSTPADTVVESTEHIQKLVCHAGSVDATMGELASFHDGEDYAQVTYSVLSGAADADPVVISPGNAVPAVGTVDTTPQYPALVGWI